jgi:hypothetical protein
VNSTDFIEVAATIPHKNGIFHKAGILGNTRLSYAFQVMEYFQ